MTLAICSTTIDWDATGSMLQGWGALGACATVVIAAMLGRAGVKDWRRQKQEERRMDVGEKLLVAAYKARDAIDGIRANFAPAAELSQAEEALKTSGFDSSLMDRDERGRVIHAQAIMTRINARKDVFTDLYAVMPSTKAFFGREIEAQLEAFLAARNSIHVSAEMYAEGHGGDEELGKSIRADLWTGHGKYAAIDPIANKVNAAIKAVEDVVLPILRGPQAKADKP